MFFLATRFAAIAAVTPTTTTVNVESDANAVNFSDPQTASSAGPQVSVTSNAFVATGSATGALVTQTIGKGRRFGGNGSAQAGVNPSGVSGFGKGRSRSTFVVSDLPYTYTLTGQLSVSGKTANAVGSASFRIIFVTTGQTVLERTLAVNGTQTLGGGGEFAIGTYRIELDWDTAGNAEGESASTTNFFQMDMSNPDEPDPPPPPPPDPENPTTMLWLNSAGGSFQTANNWNPDDVPGEDDVAEFNLITTYTVNVGTAHTQRLMVENGTVTFVSYNYTVDQTSFDVPSISIDDATLTLENGDLLGVHALIGATEDAVLEARAEARLLLSGSLRIGGAGGGTLDIAEGGVVLSAEGRIATGSADGAAVVIGSGSGWSSGNLAVGFAGHGELLVEEGGLVTSGVVTLGHGAGSEGFVRIKGDPASSDDQSRWNCAGVLTVGAAGTGSMEVLSLGEVVLSDTMIVNGSLLVTDGAAMDHSSKAVRVGVGRAGDITVRGFDPASLPARMILINDLTIGDAATGAIDVEQGGLVSCANSKVGMGAAGAVVVTGKGDQPSHWKMTSQLTIGDSNFAELAISEGGKVTAEGVTVGANVGGLGDITVRGKSGSDPSLLAANGNLVLGFGGRGHLVIEEDARVTCGSAALGVLAGSQGHVEVGVNGAPGAPAEWIISGDLAIGSIGRGELVVNNNATVTVGGTLHLFSNGFIGGTGTVAAQSTQNGGNVGPGSSPGIFTFIGDYEQTADGTLTMEIGGTTPGINQDQLVIDGDAILGGKLVLSFINDFVPKQGDQFVLLDVTGATTGDFAEVEVIGLEPGFEHAVATDAEGRLVLTAQNDGVPLSSKGQFRGLLVGEPPAHAAAGFFKLKSNGRGAFSAQFVLGGQIFAVRGAFDSTGKFSKTISRPTGSLTINLELAVVNGARVIIGTLTDGAATIEISAERGSAFHAKNAPAPQAGKYTAVLQFDTSVSASPQANGIGTATVTKGGNVTFRGVLADGQRVAHGTKLSKSGGWPIYVPLYAKKGSLFGQLQFRAEGGSDFDGTLRWARPAFTNNQGQSEAFLTTLATVGSRYVGPPTQSLVLDLPNGATVTLADPELEPPLVKDVTLTTRNKFTVTTSGPDQLAISASAGNGLVSARFIHPETSKATTVRGVLFQKANFGTGFFLRSGVTGSFELQAKP